MSVSHQCFHVAVRSANGPMNATCVTMQSCKGFVYLYMVMGKINHWSKLASLVFRGKPAHFCLEGQSPESFAVDALLRGKFDSESMITGFDSTFTHHRPPYDRHHNQEGVGLNPLTYPSTHNPPVHQSHPINKHLHPCIQPWFHKPGNPLLRPESSPPLSMPSAKRLVAVVAKPPGKRRHGSHSMVRPASCHSPPTHLSPYAD